MRITMPVTVSWLFATWWLVGGLRDFFLVRYDAAGSTRYRKVFPLLLCLSASLDLVLLGYFLAIGKRQLILIAILAFAIIWIRWSLVAKRGSCAVSKRGPRQTVLAKIRVLLQLRFLNEIWHILRSECSHSHSRSRRELRVPVLFEVVLRSG
jgi:hypothetical protein